MSYLIDVVYVGREVIKLFSVAVISPFGLAASYLFTWQT